MFRAWRQTEHHFALIWAQAYSPRQCRDVINNIVALIFYSSIVCHRAARMKQNIIGYLHAFHFGEGIDSGNHHWLVAGGAIGFSLIARHFDSILTQLRSSYYAI